MGTGLVWGRMEKGIAVVDEVNWSKKAAMADTAGSIDSSLSMRNID